MTEEGFSASDATVSPRQNIAENRLLQAYNYDNLSLFELKDKLKKMIALYSQMLYHTRGCACRLDAEHRVIFMNKDMISLFGYGKDDSDRLHNLSIFNLMSDVGKTMEAAQKIKDGIKIGTPTLQEFKAKDGGTLYTLITTTPLSKDVVGVDGTLINLVDITERKKAEEALVQSEKRYQRLFETSQDGIMARDLEGQMIDCNQAYADMLGYSKQELSQMIPKQLIPEKWHEQRQIINKRVLETGESVVFEREYRRKDGSIFPASVRTWRLTDDKDNVIGVWSTVRDITQQVELRTKLEQHSENLEKLVEERSNQLKDSERLAAIGATAGMVGHDLRNPLQAIASTVYLMKLDLKDIDEGETRNSLKESLDILIEQTSYMNKIVSDLQSFVMPVDVHKQNINLKELITSTLAEINIIEDVETNLQIKELTIETDPQLLKRVLFNLITNAIQAMPHGGKLNVNAYLNSDQVQIVVEDTGIGIPEDVKPKLFTPLFTTKAKGQGFGLAVCKRVIEAQGGTISFESEIGKGTKFMISLPTK